MFSLGIAGKIGYAVVCLLAAVTLAGSYAANYVKTSLDSIGGSDAIKSGPSTGAMNILLMGLESRTDYNGNVLPAGLLAAMHAGSVQGVENGVGGQDTNTLILIHVFAGGQKAVGISIPRDDWVTYPKTYDGQSQGKVDQAYGDAWSQSLSQTINSSMSHNQRYLVANEAGQAATVDTVQALTGVRIDHFAEVNLDGFYELANVFGGIEACLKSYNGGQNLVDYNSGFNAVRYDGYNLKQGGAQYLHLSPPQALAFVRERDNLPNGDIDRTHRQQAVIDYVIWKLEHEGILTSFSQLHSLLDTAKQYVITDQGWEILDFAGEMSALTGKNMTFETAPYITTDGHIDGQDVNLINPAQIQQAVRSAFYPGTKPPSTGQSTSLAPGATTVDVYNGGGTPMLAGQLSQALTTAGFKAGQVGNTGSQSSTEVLYGTGASASAAKIAGYFNGVSAVASSSVAAGHVEVLLGTDATSVPPGIGPATAGSAPATSPAPSSSSSSSGSSPAPDNGQSGGTVTVAGNAKYGIPCVY